MGTHTPRSLSVVGRIFAIVAIGEGATWAGLLIGMFFKYVVPVTDQLVTVFGTLHGAMFTIYVPVAIVTAVMQRWRVWVALVAVGAAIPPLVTIPLEIWLRRSGRLAPRPRRGADPAVDVDPPAGADDADRMPV